MFGRATIRLGIGPHSSSVLIGVKRIILPFSTIWKVCRLTRIVMPLGSWYKTVSFPVFCCWVELNIMKCSYRD